MATRYPPVSDPEWLLEGSPVGFRTQNIRQLDCGADLTALATGVMTSVAMPLQVGDLVTNITVKSGATAAGTPTAYWFALYSAAATPALLAQSADQATAAWAANTVKTLALATPQLITVAGVYYVGLMVTATTPPTLVGKSVGIAGAAASVLSSKVLVQTSGSSLTTTAPATIASPTTVATEPLVILT
jgi:hypothetical protein